MPTPYEGSAHSYVIDSGDQRIDGLTGHAKWGDGPTGSSAVVTYSFPNDAAVYSYSLGDDPDYRGLTAGEQALFEGALAAWAEVADIRFTAIDDTAQDVGTIRAAVSGALNDAGYAGLAYYPGSSALSGDVWFRAGDPLDDDNAFYLMAHEIGHALGLHHPFDQPDLYTDAEMTTQYSVMAYEKYSDILRDPATPMLYDILAIQHLYGANMETRAGDDVYTFAETDENLLTIWDAGGTDTIDLSNQRVGADLSLVAGTFSDIGLSRRPGDPADNVAIAFGVTIENAVGSAHADRLTGNAGANVLEGGAGDDVLEGAGGDDRLDGGDGEDTAVYRGAIADYTFAAASDEALSVVHSGGAADGSDVVSAVEWFDFADGTVGLADLLDRLDEGFTPNTVPLARDDAIDGDVTAAIVIDVLSNDTDADGDTLTITEVTAPALGTVTVNADGTLTYTPGTAGTDRFAYTVTDGNGGEAQAYATVEVTAPPAPEPAAPELLAGTQGRDFLSGGDADERLELGAGDDVGYGRDGDDVLVGGAGRDKLYGHAGNDRLDGGAGDDHLRDGAGDDHLVAGAGDDWVFLGDGADVVDLRGTSGTDRIYYFEPGEDHLALDATTFALLDSTGDGRLDEADAVVEVSSLWFEVAFGDGAEVALLRVEALSAEDFSFVG